MKYLKSKWTFLVLLLLLCPFTIAGFRLNSLIYPILWIYTPILVYKLLPKRKSLLKITLLVMAAIVFIYFGLMPLLQFALCGYGPKQDKYVNRNNHNLKLVGRDFSCYGTTGDLVFYKEYSICKFIKMEIYYKTFSDYQNILIDTLQWQKVE